MPTMKQRLDGFRHPPVKSPTNPSYSPSSNFKSYLSATSDGFAKRYIENRVLDQIDWYNAKAGKNQTFFKRWMVASIILSALIPVLTLLSDIPCSFLIKILITAASSSVTAISAILSLYHFQELWVQYRANCEILQSTLHRYLTHTGEFKDRSEEDALNLLVMSCEEYMTKEFQTWAASNTPRPDNQPSPSDSSTGS